MANPVGEDNWLAYLDETVRNARDLELRVNAVEHYKRAVSAEPGSLGIWLAYCNYFWSLWADSQAHDSGWSEEELMMGRELFTFNAALNLWQQGYEAIKYRISDSHLLWDRWVSLELELLAKTKTPEGIKRITHLYCSRLQTPHLTWDQTSEMYSSFLSEYNRAVYEDSMKEMTSRAQEAKRLIAARDPFEVELNQAVRKDDVEAQKTTLAKYLEWEMLQSRRSNDSPETAIDLCRGLYARALTGVLAKDEATWNEYVVFLSSASDLPSAESLLDVLRRAVQHCPWSGHLWSRYILAAEEARRPFAEIESIKHAATSEDQLLKDGMEGMIEMYTAWCGFLKRTAMDASATDEAVDIADVGLGAALEDVSVVGLRLCGKDFQGDPKFRLERIYIQYLTEKKGAVDEARAQWNKLAAVQMYADNHDFWFRYYMWEMFIFSSMNLPDNRSPTPSSTGANFRIPSMATSVLARAVARKSIDWPEKVLEVYLQHCNDYEMPLNIRTATDRVHRVSKEVQKRRERENEKTAAAYAAYYETRDIEETARAPDSPSNSKRKREAVVDSEDDAESASKRQKGVVNGTEPEMVSSAQPPKRDRENATVIVSNLPANVTKTKVRQYFKEYGHINNITALVQEKDDSSIALIEFKTPEEAQSAQLRDGKYFGQSQLSVKSGHDLTVYVTNYPPVANENYIRDIFKDCGEILSVRFPSLAVNTHRRFCYVSFRDREASAKAVRKEGTALEGQYKLLAKYSAPNQKKAREGALAEGREIHITNLDRAVTEPEVKEVFSKYGNVTRVNVPVTLAGKNKGFAFVDFETKDQAEKAVSEMHNVKFRNQILDVCLSKESKIKPSAKTVNVERDSASPAPSRDAEGDEAMRDSTHSSQEKPKSSDIAARTIALMGLPDTVNDARVRALIEQVGDIVKLVLLPGHGGAKIEFTDAATAGKAALQLNSMEFEGNKLRTGSVDELRHAKSQHQEDRIVYGTGSKGADPKKEMQEKRKNGTETNSNSNKFMPPPTPIRRPVLGKPGPKRGLGFMPKPAGAAKPTTSQAENGVPSKKTNAEFKAMFLASGKGGANGKADTTAAAAAEEKAEMKPEDGK